MGTVDDYAVIDSIESNYSQFVTENSEMGLVGFSPTILYNVWKLSGFRKLTDVECVYLAQRLRIRFELELTEDVKLYKMIKGVIGENKNSVDFLFLGIFAIAGIIILKLSYKPKK